MIALDYLGGMHWGGPAREPRAVLALEVEAGRLRADLADILITGDRAARGAKLVEVHGQAVVFVGAEEWQAMRRAMVAASNHLVNERGVDELTERLRRHPPRWREGHPAAEPGHLAGRWRRLERGRAGQAGSPGTSPASKAVQLRLPFLYQPSASLLAPTGGRA